MAPYDNPEPDESAEAVAPNPDPTPAEAKPAPDAGPGILTEPQPGSPAAAKAALDRMIADKMHPAWHAWHPQHAEAQRLYEELIILERGEGPEANRALGTAHGWRLKPLDAEADDSYIERVDAGVVA